MVGLTFAPLLAASLTLAAGAAAAAVFSAGIAMTAEAEKRKMMLRNFMLMVAKSRGCK